MNPGVFSIKCICRHTETNTFCRKSPLQNIDSFIGLFSKRDL